MPSVINWAPNGKTLADYKLTRVTDGDTPFLELGVRMLSIDAPEVHYPGTTKPKTHDKKLEKLGAAIAAGKHPKLGPKLAAHLVSCLDAAAGTRQLAQGEATTAKFEAILAARLGKPNSTAKRRLFVRTSDEVFDGNGRLLAYLSPKYEKAELATLAPADRRTFNLQLVEEGLAAPFLIYPSIPKPSDLDLFQDAAKKARVGGLGHYADPKSLTGYEFRFCVKLTDKKQKLEVPDRACADLSTGKVHAPENYLDVLPENRLFIWTKDVAAAKAKLGLVDQ